MLLILPKQSIRSFVWQAQLEAEEAVFAGGVVELILRQEMVADSKWPPSFGGSTSALHQVQAEGYRILSELRPSMEILVVEVMYGKGAGAVNEVSRNLSL